MMRVPLSSSAHAFEMATNEDLDAVVDILTNLMEQAKLKGKAPLLPAGAPPGQSVSGPHADAKKQLLAQDA